MPNSGRYWSAPDEWVPPPIISNDEVSPEKNYPVIIQQGSWTCSCASLAWVMSALQVPSPSRGEGMPWTEWDAVNAVRQYGGGGAVSPDYGLAWADGRDLIAVYRAYGFDTVSRVGVNWAEASSMSTRYIGQAGGARWYHWTGVRWYDPEVDVFLLANPAPTWKGVAQELDADEASWWGPWNFIWIVGLL